MSATTIPRDISQAVGNAFLIFGKFFLGMGGEEKGEEWRDVGAVGNVPERVTRWPLIILSSGENY